MDVENSVKSIPEHNRLANIANNDKNHINKFSELLTIDVATESPAVPNDKPKVLKTIVLKSLYLDCKTDRMSFRKTAKISMASAHTLISGICTMAENKVDFLSI